MVETTLSKCPMCGGRAIECGCPPVAADPLDGATCVMFGTRAIARQEENGSWTVFRGIGGDVYHPIETGCSREDALRSASLVAKTSSKAS